MSQTAEERVQAFRDAINSTPELQAKFTADGDWQEIAAAAGHEVTEDDINAYIAARPNDGLSDFELTFVTGGGALAAVCGPLTPFAPIPMLLVGGFVVFACFYCLGSKGKA